MSVKKKTRFLTIPLTMIALVAINWSGFLYPVPQAHAALSQTGPVVPVVGNTGTGFPMWYKDSNGLTLDLMEAADAFSISAPVEVGNAFSEQIGFGAEGFWWSASSTMDTPGGRAKLVLGLEAAFAGESAVDGQQSSFGRIRYVIDGLTPDATYTIKHPYGTVTETADNTGSIFVTEDIGCFAAAGATSCDPNSPLGSPLPQFNFSAALSSNIGPFLTWDTFNVDPLQTDAALLNAGRQYIGDPGIDHTVTGSPTGQNIFRVEGPGLPGGFIETNLFSVSGRLSNAVAAPPVIDAIPNKTVAINTPITFTANATDANLDAITYSITGASNIGNEATATIVPETGVFSWTPTTAGSSTFDIQASSAGPLTATTTVTIVVTSDAPVLTTISVTPATASIIEGAARQLTAIALDASGAQIVPTPTMAWTSSDETKATVNATTGLVTAVAAGTTTITATSGAQNGTSAITITPSTQVGGGLSAAIPVDPVSKFPKWYKNRNGFALELMKANDVFGISAPVEVGNAFSEAIGFGAEGFWSSADATLTTTGSKPAVLVQAVEAAFSGGEIPVDGQQSAFGRIRIRIDVNEPGTYIVTYPYGQKTYTVAQADIGAGYEINDTNDIGCFAIPGVSSCDPNNALGSPQAGFNFNAVGLSEVGPFLSWDTFNLVSNDPLLTNPANPTRKYVGDARTPHAVQGSPTGNNFFRIESTTPGVDLDPAAGVQSFIQTNLFNVSGMLADTTAPVITLNGNNPDSVVQGTSYTDPGVTVVDDVDGTITTGIVVSGLPTALDPVGAYVVTYSVSDSSGNNSIATRVVNVTSPPVVADSIVVTSAASTIVTGATQQLSIAVLDPLGAVITPTPAVTFTPVDPLVATVSPTGIVTAVGTGTTNITATVTGVPAATTTFPITVTAPLATPVATTVAAVASAPTIATGATQQLSVAVLDQNNIIITPAPTVTFVSANPAIATVDTAGVVTAVGPGTTNITVTTVGVPDAVIPINVADATISPVVTTVNVATATPVIVTGATQQLLAVALDQNGIIVNPAPETITFATDAPAVANVNPTTGVITAGSTTGTATITATVTGAGGPVDTIVLTVIDPATPIVTTVDVATAATTVATGTTQQLSIAVLDQNGAAIVSPPAITLVSDTPSVATVDPETGVITAVSPGTATITLTSDGHTDTQIITVTAGGADIVAPTITVTGNNPAIVVVNTTYTDEGATATDIVDGDRTANITTTGLPINTTVLGDNVITYSVSDVAGNDAVATRIVRVISAIVVPPTITTIEVITTAPIATVGVPQTFIADAHDQNGVKLDDQPEFTWTSSNPSVGTINNAGVFTPISAGTTDITATSGGLTRTTTVIVESATAPPVDSSLTPIYRLYNTVTGAHVYTRGETERAFIMNKWSSFEFTDGVPAFSASLTASTGLTPIYRLYNTQTGVHLYTRGEVDRDFVLNKFPAFEFTDGVPAFYASLTEQAGLTPIYRLYNTETGVHLYTRGDSEREFIMNKWSAFEFTDGRPAFYAKIN